MSIVNGCRAAAITEDAALEATRVSDLFAHIMLRVLSENLILEISSNQVSLAQVQALRFIWLHDKVLMGDLAAGLGITYPSATNMVKRLERRALVTRTPNPEDRREVEVRLTDAGLDLVERMEAERHRRLAATLAAMDPEDRSALLRGLRAFVATAVTALGDITEEICLRCGLRRSDKCPLCAQRRREGTCNGC